MAGKILLETIDNLYAKLGDEIDNLTVDRVVFGLFFTGVKLSNGVGGLSYTPIKSLNDAVCCPSSAEAMPFSGKMVGKNVRYFLDGMFSGQALKKTLGIAIINALETTCWNLGKRNENYVVHRDTDPIEMMKITEGSYTVVVGALVPYIKTLIKENREFSILEMDRSTLKGKELDHFVPADEFASIVPKADYMIITGTTLINDTLEGLLELVKPGAKIIVVGPTVSMEPEPLFKRNVNYVGGVLVTDPDRLLDILAEAGSGYHFFNKYAEKITISQK